jgi:hypothetical protein
MYALRLVHTNTAALWHTYTLLLCGMLWPDVQKKRGVGQIYPSL